MQFSMILTTDDQTASDLRILLRGDTSRGVRGMQLLLLVQHLLDLLHFLRIAVFFQTWFRACAERIKTNIGMHQMQNHSGVVWSKFSIGHDQKLNWKYTNLLFLPIKLKLIEFFEFCSDFSTVILGDHPWHWQQTQSPKVLWQRSRFTEAIFWCNTGTLATKA